MDEIKLKTYIVTVPYSGRCDFVVDACDEVEAKSKAAEYYKNKKFENALGMSMEQSIDKEAFDLVEPRLVSG